MEIINKVKYLKILRSISIAIIFLLACFVLIYFYSLNKKPEDIKEIQIAGQTVKVNLALTDVVQRKGLSGLQNLPENKGMLFIFDKVGRYPFWMKDMNFPIDMIWIGANMKVVYIKKDATPDSYPESFGMNVDTKYVLEISAGFSDQHNLKVGDSVQFTY